MSAHPPFHFLPLFGVASPPRSCDVPAIFAPVDLCSLAVAPWGRARSPECGPDLLRTYGATGRSGVLLVEGKPTPNIDRLAKEGEFAPPTSTLAQPILGSASRAALMTGVIPSRRAPRRELPPAGRRSASAIRETGRWRQMFKFQPGYATGMGRKSGTRRRAAVSSERGTEFDEYFGLHYSNDMRPQTGPNIVAGLPLFRRRRT